MSSWNYYSYTSSDHLSVEVNSDGYSFPLNQYDTAYDPVMTPLFDLDSLGLDIAGICESADLAGKRR